jgi:hypothetical protein
MSNAYYNALRNARPDNFYNMNKLKNLVGLANAAENNEEAITRNHQQYKSELDEINRELYKFREPIYPRLQNYKVKGRFWGTNKKKTQKAYSNASAKYTANYNKYNNNTRNLRTRRKNITAKLNLISKRNMVQRRKKNLEYEKSKPVIEKPSEPSESMIDEFKTYGYDYVPETKGYMAGSSPKNYVEGKPAYFKYELSRTFTTKNNRNNGWTFNEETTHTEHQNRTGYPYQVTNYVYTRTLPEGYPGEIIYEDDWESALEMLRNLKQ